MIYIYITTTNMLLYTKLIGTIVSGAWTDGMWGWDGGSRIISNVRLAPGQIITISIVSSYYLQHKCPDTVWWFKCSAVCSTNRAEYTEYIIQQCNAFIWIAVTQHPAILAVQRNVFPSQMIFIKQHYRRHFVIAFIWICLWPYCISLLMVYRLTRD